VPVDFCPSDQQHTLRLAVRELVSQFDLTYWLEKDRAHAFPEEFWRAKNTVARAWACWK
jgi:acyl-CoA dehydrogenase